jgi:hypothetical protein
MKSIWTHDENGKLFCKWVSTETNHSELSDDELRTRINDYTNELLQRQLEDC